MREDRKGSRRESSELWGSRLAPVRCTLYLEALEALEAEARCAWRPGRG